MTGNRVYITVRAPLAEMGTTARKARNRCNGLITPNRPMSMEATSGKEPINHVGKLYNLLSIQIANDIAENVHGMKMCIFAFFPQIGHPLMSL
jgi:S-adenosylmethionine synthetase